MPEGAVYVGRPTKFGNHFTPGMPNFFLGRDLTSQDCVDRYRAHVVDNRFSCISLFDVITELKGKDLACWCSLDKPCHADALIELADLTA